MAGGDGAQGVSRELCGGARQKAISKPALFFSSAAKIFDSH
jgi:hypothetical protein